MSGEMNNPLPEGWRWVKLGEVCDVIGGTTPNSGESSFWNGEIIWITPTDLGKLKNRFIIDSDRKISKHGFDNSNLTMLPVGSVVLSSRAPIGYLGIASIPLCTNQGCKSFIPGKSVDAEFLYHTLRISVNQLQKLGSGATFAEISKTQLENFIIPLPPLPEQKRIAAILNEQMAAVEKSRAAAEAQLEAAKALPAAYLREVFPGPGEVLPEGWRWVKLGEVCEIIAGQSPPGETYRNYPEGLPFFQGKADFGKINPVPRVWCVSPTKIANPGDILISVRAPVGPTNVADTECCIGRGLAAIRSTSSSFKDYILYSLRYFESSLSSKGSGSTFDAINRDDLENLPIPLPPIPDQKRIAAHLTERLSQTEKLCTTLEEQLNEINALPSSILRKAFSGGL